MIGVSPFFSLITETRFGPSNSQEEMPVTMTFRLYQEGLTTRLSSSAMHLIIRPEPTSILNQLR